MGNCLVTKLKSVVDNDNLKLFDTIELVFDWSGSNKNAIIKQYPNDLKIGGVGVKFTIISNGSFVKGSSTDIGQYYEMDNVQETVRIVPTDINTTTTVRIVGLSDFTVWSALSMPSFIYSNYQDVLPYITIGRADLFLPQATSGNTNADVIKDIPNPTSFTELVIGGNSIYTMSDFKGVGRYTSITSLPDIKLLNTGNLSDISNMVNLTSFNGTRMQSLNGVVSGDIASIANLTALQTLELNSCTHVSGQLVSLGKMGSLNRLTLYNTQITGSIESLVAAFVDNGITSGSIGFINPNAYITYEGNVLVGHKALSWNGTSNITLTDIE